MSSSIQGLKIKQVRQLCYEQLQKMDGDETTRVILGEPRHGKEEEREDEICVNEIFELTMDLATPTDKRETGSGNTSEESLSFVREESSSLDAIKLSSQCNPSPGHKLLSSSEDNEMRVSDISDGDRSECDESDEVQQPISNPCTSLDVHTSTHITAQQRSLSAQADDTIELAAGVPAGKIDREIFSREGEEIKEKEDKTKEEEEEEEEENNEDKEENNEDEEENNEDEEEWKIDQDDWSIGSSQAMEIMLRQRALEAALRRRTSTSDVAAHSYKTQEDTHTVAEDEGKEEEMEDLEEQLRQKALQSLLKRHKSK